MDPQATTAAPNMMRTAAVAVLGWLVIALVPTFLFSNYHLFQATMAVVYATAILGLAILTGFNGQISPRSRCVLCYRRLRDRDPDVSSTRCPTGPRCLSRRLSVPGSGFLIGLPALRLGGLYLALTTFRTCRCGAAVAEAQRTEPHLGRAGWSSISRTRRSVSIYPRSMALSSPLVRCRALFLVAWNIVRGRIGRLAMAIATMRLPLRRWASTLPC